MPAHNFLLDICPVESISLSSFSKREKTLRKGSEPVTCTPADETGLNKVDVVPGEVEVQQAAIWKKKDTSKIKDFKHVEIISDWTYCTAYKGSLRFLSNHA